LREKTSLTATSGKGLAELQHGKNLNPVSIMITVVCTAV